MRYSTTALFIVSPKLTESINENTELAAGLYTYKGSEDPDASGDGRPSDNDFVDNEVRNTEMGVYLRNMDDTLIEGEFNDDIINSICFCFLSDKFIWSLLPPPSFSTGNTFTGTNRLEFNDCKDTTWRDNDMPSSVCLKAEDSSFTGDEPADSCY